MRHVLALLLLLLAIQANAKLNLYNCINNQDKKTCNASCKKINEPHTFEFLVNTSNNTVIKNFYISNNPEKSEPLENCSVADKNNWVCKVLIWDKDLKTKDRLLGSQIMTNGVFFFDWADVSENHPVWCMK